MKKAYTIENVYAFGKRYQVVLVTDIEINDTIEADNREAMFQILWEVWMKGSEQAIKELALMLLYLTSWQDKPARMRPDANGRVSWKGYNFDTLDALAEEGLIYGERHSKLVTLDNSGILKARELLVEYGITESELQ